MYFLVLGNGSYSIDKSSDSKCIYNGSDEDKLLFFVNIFIIGVVFFFFLFEEFFWFFNFLFLEFVGLFKGGFYIIICKFGLFLFKNNI